MIILYHIVLNDIDYIKKKCQVCGKYFFSDKNITLYCNGKYSEDILPVKNMKLKHLKKKKKKMKNLYMANIDKYMQKKLWQ